MADGAEAPRHTLTLADQVFVNACAVVVLGNGIENEPMMIEAARQVRDRLSLGNPHVARVATEWDRFEAEAAKLPRPCTYVLGRALGAFFMWRCGLAEEALRLREGRDG